MTEQELITFLQKTGRTPNMIRDIVAALSVPGTRQLLESTIGPRTDEQWAEISSIRTKDFVETIRVLESGGAIMDDVGIMRRGDFPA